MKNTILVPTDFSTNSLSATRYACQLANKRNFKIHLFHCYTSHTAVFEDDNTREQDQTALLKADILMSELVDQLKASFENVGFTSVCIRGLINEKLPAELKKSDYLLVIMGAKGNSSKKSFYWGSNTVAITAQATVPVMVLPEGYETFQPKHISLLTKFRPEELETLREYTRIIGGVDELTLTHVYRETDDYDDVESRLQSWEFTIKEMNIIPTTRSLSAPISKADINLDTVPEVVNKLIEDSNPDIVLITKTRKSFFERLFSTSVSKALTLELKKPAFFDKIDES